MGRNRRRRNQRRRRTQRDEQEQPQSRRAGWREQVDSFGGFTVIGTLGVALIGVIVLVALNLPGSDGPSDTPWEPVVRSQVEGRLEGDPAAPVRIIEYSDFSCPHCQSFTNDTAPLLLEEYIETGQVALEYRHMAILGQGSLQAAAASECALDQGRFWDYHDLLFLRQSGASAFSNGNLKDFAREVQAEFPDFDVDAFDRCLDSGVKEDQVVQATNEGRDLGVSSTPTFFVNGVPLRGAQPIENFRQVIDGALAE